MQVIHIDKLTEKRLDNSIEGKHRGIHHSRVPIPAKIEESVEEQFSRITIPKLQDYKLCKKWST